MKKQYTKKQIEESIKHWTKVLESMSDPDDAKVVASAKDNIGSIEEMIEEIEENGHTALNNDIFFSLVGFNKWCKEEKKRNGIEESLDESKDYSMVDIIEFSGADDELNRIPLTTAKKLFDKVQDYCGNDPLKGIYICLTTHYPTAYPVRDKQDLEEIASSADAIA